MGFDPDTISYLKAMDGDVRRALERLLEAQVQDLERAVLQLNVTSEADYAPLAIRRAELQGARKLVAGVTGYLNSLRKRNPPAA